DVVVVVVVGPLDLPRGGVDRHPDTSPRPRPAGCCSVGNATTRAAPTKRRLLVRTSGAHAVGIAPSGRLLPCGRRLRPDACYATKPLVGASRARRSHSPARATPARPPP